MQSKKKVRERFDDKLLVEGADDQHVVWAICKQFQVKETFDVVDLEGIDNLMADISVRPKQADLSCLGIIVDADTDVKERWNQLRNEHTESGYNIPDEPTPSGTIIATEGLPKVGIWLMPDNQNPGMLEDFIRQLIVSDDDCLAFAEEALQKLENQSLARYKPAHRSKALIHTWLAWQEDPGTPMGWAITKHYLTTDLALCQRFVDWLNRLFM